MRPTWIALICVLSMGLGCPTPDDDDDNTGDDDTGPGELLTLVDTLPHPADGWPGNGTGLTWIDDRLWVGFGWYLWELDPDDGTVIQTHSDNDGGFAGGEMFHGLAHDATLWSVGYQLDRVVHFDGHPPTAGALESWSSGSASAVAAAHDGAALWSVNGTDLVRYDMSDDMLYAEEIDLGDYHVDGLTHGAASPALWSCGNDLGGLGFTIVRHRTDGTMDFDATFPLQWHCDALATDGTHLWVSVFDEDGDADKELRRYSINF